MAELTFDRVSLKHQVQLEPYFIALYISDVMFGVAPIREGGVLLECGVCLCVLSCFRGIRLFETLWTVAHQASVSMGFPRQEYWSGLPFPPPGDSSPPRNETHISYVPCIGRRVLYH